MFGQRTAVSTIAGAAKNCDDYFGDVDLVVARAAVVMLYDWIN